MSQSPTDQDPTDGSSCATLGANRADGTSESDTLVIRPSRPGSLIPRRRRPPSAGFDVFAQLEGRRISQYWAGRHLYRGPDPEADVPCIRLLPGQRAHIPLGFRVNLPAGVEAQLRTRAETVAENGLTVLAAEPVPSAAGDDLDGEWTVLVRNDGDLTISIEDGYPVATVVFARVLPAD